MSLGSEKLSMEDRLRVEARGVGAFEGPIGRRHDNTKKPNSPKMTAARIAFQRNRLITSSPQAPRTFRDIAKTLHRHTSVVIRMIDGIGAAGNVCKREDSRDPRTGGTDIRSGDRRGRESSWTGRFACAALNSRR